MENQIETTQPVEIQKAEKGTFVTMPEVIDMKGLRLQGFSLQAIADRLGRNIKTVKRSLELFEKILPDEPNLKYRIIDRVEEIAERHLQNAEIICQAADNQVMRKIYLEETSAMDAAKIRQIYGGFLNPTLGIKDGTTPDDGSDKNPKIINFIQNIINIQNNQKQDDRLRPTTRTESSAGANDDGGKEACVEGVVS